MSIGSDEEPVTGADRLNIALLAFTGCIGEAIEDICSSGLTIGDSYVPFDPDEGECEDDEDSVYCSQVWVRVDSVTPVSVGVGFDGEDCASTMRLELEVGVLRCFEARPEGEAPTVSEVLAAAVQAMTDMNALYCAAMGCEVWEQINSGSWLPIGPLGGQYGGTWSFSVEI